MLNNEMKEILEKAQPRGWVLEPDAKRLLGLAGLEVPRHVQTRDPEEAIKFASDIGFPVVAKVISAKVMHKSDAGGVKTGIQGEEQLRQVMESFSGIEGYEGTLVEKTVSGMELIVGAKVDYQFGPVILLGIGGTAVELYKDTVIRMAPLTQHDVESMVNGLRGGSLLQGYRGSRPVNLEELSRTMITFSQLVMEMADWIESVDLNPLMCSAEGCTVADARIILARKGA